MKRATIFCNVTKVKAPAEIIKNLESELKIEIEF